MEMTGEIKNHLTANVHISKRRIIMSNFFGGLAWGFGTVIGATVVVAILGALLNLTGIFEVFGQFLQLNASIKPLR